MDVRFMKSKHLDVLTILANFRVHPRALVFHEKDFLVDGWDAELEPYPTRQHQRFEILSREIGCDEGLELWDREDSVLVFLRDV